MLSIHEINVRKLVIGPLAIILPLFIYLQYAGGDAVVAHWFYDPLLQRFPLKKDFWLRDILHDDARTLMISVLIIILVSWAGSIFVSTLNSQRRRLAYLAVAIIASVSLVNLGKQVSNIDCPWDLQEYGGDRPHIQLFSDKPDDIPRGRCFPGGHSSSGFALFALYFVGGASRRRRWLQLLPGFVLGALFSLVQWARGAHFPSHDVLSAYLCWLAAVLTYYAFARNQADKNQLDYR